jgi:hypothetical protein
LITFHDAALVALGLHRIEVDLKARGLRFEGGKLLGEVYAIGLGGNIGAAKMTSCDGGSAAVQRSCENAAGLRC